MVSGRRLISARSGQARQQDRYSEAVGRALLEHSSELVGLQSVDGTMLYVNPVVRRMLGYEPDLVIGRSVFEFIHPDDAEPVVAAQRRLVEVGGVGPGMETRIRHADGSWRVLDVVSTNLLDTPTGALMFIARDVTERREADRVSREREASFRLLAENATDVITRTDASGRCLYASPSAEAVLGYRPDRLVGERVSRLLGTDGDPALEEAQGLIDLGATTFTITLEAARRDGTRIWLESTSRVVRDPVSGDLTEVHSSARDVSDRIRSEERFEALVRNSSDIITILGSDGSWRYSSPAGTRLLGWPRGYEPDGGIFSLLHPDDIETAAKALQEVVEGTRGPDAPVILRGRARDGQYRYFETIGQNLIDDPVVGGIVLNARDVTDRREAEQRYQDLVEAAPDAIIIIDERGDIQLVNAQTEALFGYPRDALLGRSVDTLIPARFRALHATNRRGFFEEPKVRPMGAGRGLFGRRLDGSEFPVEISLSPFATDDSIVVLAAIRDVTERLEIQEQLRHQAVEVERLSAQRERAELETALERARRFESLGRLAGGVAHDVNTLIGVVMIYLNSILLDADERQQAEAEKARSAIRRIARLTRQLLEYGSRGGLASETFDPDDVIPGILDLTRTMARGVATRHEPAGCPAAVQMPPSNFEQMLINVLANACDAMPDGGTVTVTTDVLIVDVVDAGGDRGGRPFVRLRVADTGRGVSGELAATAFEPFVTTRGEDSGTGLGLAIVQDIVEEAGGRASMEPRLGGGVVVSLLVPAVEPASQ